MFVMKRSSTAMSLDSAFDSAFLRRPRMTRTDLAGQRPLVVPNCLACEARPMPPAKRRKGMTCLCSWTSARYV